MPMVWPASEAIKVRSPVTGQFISVDGEDVPITYLVQKAIDQGDLLLYDPSEGPDALLYVPGNAGTLGLLIDTHLQTMIGLYPNHIVTCVGGTTEGDGKEGQFQWRPASTTEEDGTDVIQVGTRTGRWHRITALGGGEGTSSITLDSPDNSPDAAVQTILDKNNLAIFLDTKWVGGYSLFTTANTSYVERMVDRTGNLVIAQSELTRKPVFNSTTGMLEFDGDNDVLTTDEEHEILGDLGGSNSYWWVGVSQMTESPPLSASRYLYSIGNKNGQYLGQYQNNNASGRDYYVRNSGTATNTDSTLAATTNLVIESCVYDGGDTQYSFWRGNTAGVQGATNVRTPVCTHFTLGALSYHATRPESHWMGSIGQQLFFFGLPGAGEREEIVSLIASYAGVSL